MALQRREQLPVGLNFEVGNSRGCIERIPDGPDAPVRVLVSNIGDGTLQLVEVAADGKLRSRGKAQVGKAPKRISFVPSVARE